MEQPPRCHADGPELSLVAPAVTAHQQVEPYSQAPRPAGTGQLVARDRPADADLDDEEIRQDISECLDAAPTRQSMAFVLREIEGFSTEEICNILEVTRTNLGVMLHRIRNRLRECLEAMGVRT